MDLFDAANDDNNQTNNNEYSNTTDRKRNGEDKVNDGKKTQSKVETNRTTHDKSTSPEYFIDEKLPCIASEETINEGYRLYKYHFKREALLKHLDIPEFITNGSRPINMKNLVKLIDQFRVSPQRQWVYEQAERVQLETLNFHTFRDLLGELFQEGGVTWERVLVLFFFCTDLSIRAVHENLFRCLYRIHNWTSVYIRNTLSHWVEQHGGWTVVLSQSVHQLGQAALITLCCFSIVAFAIYFKNKSL